MITNVSWAQKDISRNNSLSFTIGPSFFFESHLTKPKSETFLPTGAYLLKNFMLKKRYSLSTGLNFIYDSYGSTGYISISPGYSGPLQIISKVVIIDIPVRLNYDLINENNKLDLFLYSEIKNAIVSRNIEYNPEVIMTPVYKLGYNLFLGAGVEMDIKIDDKFSLIFSPGVHYPLVGVLTQMGLMDLQFGLKYNLLK